MNLLQVESNTDIEHYFDELTDKHFTPLITSPTRVTSKTKTLIDNIFYNEFCSNIVSGNLTVGISDHMPQFALIPTSKSIIPQTKQIKYSRKCKNVNVDAFNQDLDKINWHTNGMEDVDQYGTNLLNVFNQILDIHAPLTEIKQSKKHIKHNTKPWITNDIIKLIRVKDKTYQQFIKESDLT